MQQLYVRLTSIMLRAVDLPPNATIYMKININGIAICDAIDKNVETSQAFLKWHDALEFAQVHRLQSL